MEAAAAAGVIQAGPEDVSEVTEIEEIHTHCHHQHFHHGLLLGLSAFGIAKRIPTTIGAQKPPRPY